MKRPQIKILENRQNIQHFSSIPAELESLVSEKTQGILQAGKQEEVQEISQAQDFEILKT